MWVLLGTVLLVALTIDVFITVFYPEGHGGPISRWQNRLTWWASRAVRDQMGHRGDVIPSWGRWMEGTALELHHIRQAHTQYPILHYFWTRNRREALTVQLRKLVDLYEGESALSSKPDARTLLSHPGPRSMEKALREYVDDVLARFVAPLGEKRGDSLRESLSHLNRYMRYE